VTGEPIVGPSIVAFFRLVFAPLGAAPESGRQFQSSGGSAIPHTLPWLYNDTPIKKLFASLPKGRQFATRPDALSSALAVHLGVPEFQLARPATRGSAALRTYYHSNALRRERMPAIHAGD